MICTALVALVQAEASGVRTEAVPPRGTPAKRAWIIRQVFGPDGPAAVRVAMCESGLRPWARNGQYLGIMQMGSSERARYGHDPRNVWIQARAAYRYFVASGRDWSPWACKP